MSTGVQLYAWMDWMGLQMGCECVCLYLGVAPVDADDDVPQLDPWRGRHAVLNSHPVEEVGDAPAYLILKIINGLGAYIYGVSNRSNRRVQHTCC